MESTASTFHSSSKAGLTSVRLMQHTWLLPHNPSETAFLAPGVLVTAHILPRPSQSLATIAFPSPSPPSQGFKNQRATWLCTNHTLVFASLAFQGSLPPRLSRLPGQAPTAQTIRTIILLLRPQIHGSPDRIAIRLRSKTHLIDEATPVWERRCATHFQEEKTPLQLNQTRCSVIFFCRPLRLPLRRRPYCVFQNSGPICSIDPTPNSRVSPKSRGSRTRSLPA